MFVPDAVSLRDLRKTSELKEVMDASVDQAADATLDDKMADLDNKDPSSNYGYYMWI